MVSSYIVNIEDFDEVNSKLNFKPWGGKPKRGSQDTVVYFLFHAKEYFTSSYPVKKTISVEELLSKYVQWRLAQ